MAAGEIVQNRKGFLLASTGRRGRGPGKPRLFIIPVQGSGALESRLRRSILAERTQADSKMIKHTRVILVAFRAGDQLIERGVAEPSLMAKRSGPEIDGERQQCGQ